MLRKIVWKDDNRTKCIVGTITEVELFFEVIDNSGKHFLIAKNCVISIEES